MDELISSETLIIPRYYRGPENSGNGGYTSGLVAAHIEGAAEVTLKAPIPLDKDLRIERGAQSAKLFDGETELAFARAALLDITPPPAVGVEKAKSESKFYAGWNSHLAASCFVCGPTRKDGLQIYCGSEILGRPVSSPWIPRAEECARDGLVKTKILWAALDCPNYFALERPQLPALLGQMTAQIFKRPKAGQPCVAMGWKIAIEGRKNFAASALYDAAGALIGAAKTLWIELRLGGGA